MKKISLSLTILFLFSLLAIISVRADDNTAELELEAKIETATEAYKKAEKNFQSVALDIKSEMDKTAQSWMETYPKLPKKDKGAYAKQKEAIEKVYQKEEFRANMKKSKTLLSYDRYAYNKALQLEYEPSAENLCALAIAVGVQAEVLEVGFEYSEQNSSLTMIGKEMRLANLEEIKKLANLKETTNGYSKKINKAYDAKEEASLYLKKLLEARKKLKKKE